jgi:Co/Zn/Cd efflux system component
MFAAEVTAGIAAGSASLEADALDFFADAANYAISLAVAERALAWRARAALLKGMTLIALGSARATTRSAILPCFLRPPGCSVRGQAGLTS